MKSELEIAKENIRRYFRFKEEYENSSDKLPMTKDIVTNRYNKLIGVWEEDAKQEDGQ